jgi:predicted ATP-dependent protease
VLIPRSNVQHLMLRQDVVDAVAAGRFAVYPIATIDEGIEVLTGVPAGQRDAEGHYPEGTVNRKVEDRLAEMAEKSKAFEQEVRGARSDRPRPKATDEEEGPSG